MKKSLLKVSFISILAIIISGSAFGVTPPPPPEQECPFPGTFTSLQSGTYSKALEGYMWSTETCTLGHYCPGINGFCPYGDVDKGINSCPSNYDNNATGLTSIEECCLNGYDSNTGLCIESSEPTPSRVPGRIAKDETSPECDDTTLGTASGTTNFEADWTANTITLAWDNNGATTDATGGASTCTYDQSFTLPSAPTRTGYNFAGWKVKTGPAMCSGGTLTSSTSVSATGYTRLNGDTGDKEADYGLTPGSGEWAVTVPTGIVKGMARCSTVGSGYSRGQIATEEVTDNNGTGQYCWCQTTSYTPAGGEMCMSASSSWVFDYYNRADICAYGCAANCMNLIEGDSDFRGALFGLLGA